MLDPYTPFGTLVGSEMAPKSRFPQNSRRKCDFNRIFDDVMKDMMILCMSQYCLLRYWLTFDVKSIETLICHLGPQAVSHPYTHEFCNVEFFVKDTLEMHFVWFFYYVMKDKMALCILKYNVLNIAVHVLYSQLRLPSLRPLLSMPITHNVFHLQAQFSHWKQAINR